MYPIRFECVDNETDDLLFIVEMFDNKAANISIKTLVNVELWDEIAPLIREALKGMDL